MRDMTPLSPPCHYCHSLLEKKEIERGGGLLRKRKGNGVTAVTVVTPTDWPKTSNVTETRINQRSPARQP